MEHSELKILTLPQSIIGRTDVGRLVREAKELDDFLEQAAIRQSGSSLKLPKTSRLMDELVQSNKLNPLVKADRRHVMTFLQETYKQAPVLHMSFNADPSPRFLLRLISWLRQEIHPLVLLETGLQPSLGAGCIVRTSNKVFDFSLRERFKHQRGLLLEQLKGTDAK